MNPNKETTFSCELDCPEETKERLKQMVEQTEASLYVKIDGELVEAIKLKKTENITWEQYQAIVKMFMKDESSGH